MGSKLENTCTVSCLKTVILVFNFIYWLSGIGLMGVGIWTLVYKNDYDSLLGSDRYLIISSLMIVAGSVIAFVGVCGCWGTAKESRFLLISFLIMMVIIFVIEIAVVVMAFLYDNQVYDELVGSLEVAMNKYGYDPKVDDAMDNLQKNFKCCGSFDSSNWNATRWYETGLNKNNTVPDSCCKTISNACAVRDHPSNINKVGCISMLKMFLQEHLNILIIVAISMAVIELIGMILVGVLITNVEDY